MIAVSLKERVGWRVALMMEFKVGMRLLITYHKNKVRKKWDKFLLSYSGRTGHTRYWRDWSSDVCSSDLQSIMITPATLATFAPRSEGMQAFARWFEVYSWPYYLVFTLLIIFFTYFYTAIIYNPVDIAENLKKQGAFVPGVKPGARTADYIDRIMGRR